MAFTSTAIDFSMITQVAFQFRIEAFQIIIHLKFYILSPSHMKLPSIEGIDPKKLSRAVRKDGFTLNLQEMLDAVKGALVLLAINNLESALKAEKLMSTYNSL